jgi:hypothetical protein
VATEVKLSIPAPHQRAVEQLATLSDDSFAELIRAATEYDGEYSIDRLSDLLSTHGTTRNLTAVLVAGQGALPTLGSVEAMATAVARAAGVDEDHIEGTASRVAELFRTPSVFAITKLLSLQREVDRVVLGLRIVTDVRPAFGGSAEQSDDPGDMVGMVVTHTLRIDFAQDAETKSLFFGVDSEDLEELQTQVERAQQKADKVAKRISGADLHILKP